LFAQLKLNKVYFDFESINPATCVVDDTAPYTQVVTQVSIIKNNDNSINIVIDPQKITVDDFRKIIDLIFNGNDCSYVVYNKSFECTRLTEMAALINDETYTQKVTDIKNNIFDLADFFKPSRTNDLITIHELRGFYSIKNVLPIVQKYAPEICQKVGVKKYDELEGIHRGDEALNQTSRRFFNLLNDKEWQQITTQLQQYCENDVRAMIAIELYVKYIIS
jgi:hypothetical protein